MKIKASTITAAALLALTAQTVSAAEAVGYNVVTVPANSDVLVSVPFNNNVEATFTVDSVAGTGITVNEALSADTYDSSYYIRVIDGAGEGLWSTITANGSGGLTIADDLSGYVANGDTLRVYAHHTVGSLFPEGMYGVSYTNNVSLLFVDNDATGQNKVTASTVTYVPFLSSWNNLGKIVSPETKMIIRNSSAVELTYISSGDAPDYNVSYLLPATTANDLHVGSGYPIGVTADAIAGGAGRSILLYDNDATGQNKLPAATVTYVPFLSDWNSPNTAVAASEGFILRSSSSEVGGIVTVQKPY